MKVARQLSGYFCDDIRDEIDGKVTLVGCYMGSLGVSKFPAIIPKLCAYVRLLAPKDREFTQVRLIVRRDDEVIIDGLLEAPIEDVPEGDEYTGVQSIYSRIVIRNLAVAETCVMKVRAIADGEELAGLGLRIQLGAVDLGTKLVTS